MTGCLIILSAMKRFRLPQSCSCQEGLPSKLQSGEYDIYRQLTISSLSPTIVLKNNPVANIPYNQDTSEEESYRKQWDTQIIFVLRSSIFA